MSETCVLSSLVFSCESESSSNGDHHHLSWRSSTFHVACSPLSISISFLSFISSSIFHFSIAHCVYVLAFASIFQFGSLHHNCFFFCFFTSTTLHHFSPYIVFFLLPLEVNLQTYLTTWLSSCPVGILPKSHLIIAKIQITNKVSPLKWTNLKLTHIMWYQSMVILCLFSLSLFRHFTFLHVYILAFTFKQFQFCLYFLVIYISTIFID